MEQALHADVQASERCSVPMQQSPECRPGGGTKGGRGGGGGSDSWIIGQWDKCVEVRLCNDNLQL